MVRLNKQKLSYFCVVVWCIFGLTLAAHALMQQDITQQKLNKEPRIVFSGSQNSPPLWWLDESGQAQGFFVDIQQSLGSHGNRVVVNTLADWQEAMTAVESGQADAIALFASPERATRFDFSIPFFHLGHGIFSHSKGRQFRNLLDLEGSRVALVEDAFAAGKFADEQVATDVLLVATELDCLLAVHNRQADACIETTLVSRRNAEGLNVHQTSPPFWHQSYVFAVKKGNTETLNWLNDQLTAMHADGSFFEVYQKWQSEIEWSPPTIRDHLSMVAWIVIPLLVVFAIGFAVNRFLKSELEKRTRQLRYHAEHDMLTGLLNYQSLVQELEKRFNSDPNWHPVVVFIRLKNLKTVAGIFGRMGHEKLIKDFAKKLSELNFLLAAHLGVGFYAIVTNPGESPKKIFRKLSFSCEIDGVKVDPNLVMGISSVPITTTISESRSDECVRRAIIAYSAALKNNQSWNLYSPQLEPDSKNLILLHDAQHNGTRDMFLVFQPKLDLRSGHIREAEALIRWNHPTLGLISPAVFIPLLESTGLIRNVTRWVIESAIKAINKLTDLDENFSISVNISSRDLTDWDFVNFLTKKVDPKIRSRLCLEITETGIIDDFDHAQEVIKILDSAGICCAIDDFGTGHSCLVYLSKFDIAEVKLDRSFVGDILANTRDQEIVTSTVELAHTLGHRVTAEGVEDIETLKLLADMQCDTAQGYVIAKPMALKDLKKMLGQRCFTEDFELIEIN